jgi:hypothetical protein
MNWHDYFIYDAETGSLIWRPRPLEHFVSQRGHSVWNARYAGKEAGRRGDKYNGNPKAIDVSVNKKFCKAHRVIWEMMVGLIPEGMQVDHIDGNAFNNRLANLRLVTNQQNQWNKGTYSHNTSGHPGVVWDKSREKFLSYLEHNGKRVHSKRFDTLEEAIVARQQAEIQYFGEYRFEATQSQ